MITRRKTLCLLTASVAVPTAAFGKGATEIMWDDLIPPGVPYAEIVGEGDIDLVNDTWNPIYDANAKKFNTTLDGKRIRMPGYIIPLELDATGVTEFMLVPYLGACIHVPPPPPNQLVLATAEKAWPSDQMWDAVWVTGILKIDLQDTDLATVGYSLQADTIELYEY